MPHPAFSLPTPVSITGRSSSITNSFIQAIVPVIPPMDAEVEEALAILGMTADDVRCAYCGDPHSEWDHLRPLVRNQRPTGFITEIGNLVPACGKCNQSKGNKPWRDWINSRARRGPRTRGVANLEERIERLARFEEWRRPEPIDLRAMIGEDLWDKHWENRERVLAAMRESQQLAQAIRRTVEERHRPVASEPDTRTTPSRTVAEYARETAALRLGRAPDTLSLLRSIGMSCFVRFFHLFSDRSWTSGEVAALLPEEMAAGARRSRTSVARRIFRERREREALELIAASTKVDTATVEGARALLRGLGAG